MTFPPRPLHTVSPAPPVPPLIAEPPATSLVAPPPPPTSMSTVEPRSTAVLPPPEAPSSLPVALEWVPPLPITQWMVDPSGT